MIRILFTIVAVVAAMLGVVLPMPELFVAAGLALLITIALMIVRMQRRRSNHQNAASAYAEPKGGPDSDMAALGILEIRPRAKGLGSTDRPTNPPSSEQYRSGREWAFGDGTPKEPEAPGKPDAESELTGDAEDPGFSGTVGAVEERSFHERAEIEGVVGMTGPEGRAGHFGAADDPGGHAAAVERRQADPTANGTRSAIPMQSTITIKEKAQTVRASVDESAQEHYRDVLVPYLQAFRAAVDAHTVCLLNQPADTLHYHIEAIVSVNAYARSGGNFSTKTPLLQTRESHAAADVRRVADNDFPASGLGYYREAIAVKSLAVAAVPRPSTRTRYVLLADSMKEDGLDSDRCRSIMSHFARLLGALIEESSGADILDAYDYQRPRRDIISDEMANSRKEHRPLALALVHLNRAEAVADRGEREVKNAERILAGHLRKTAREARVERFGELTFGVFFIATAAEVERWAVKVQRDLEAAEGPLEGGVCIGIALLQDRHADADAFRLDATDALREAYDTGTCTIVE